MFTELPRILSPNLGCPIILPPEELHSAGLDVVTAEGENSSAGQLRLVARPSFPGEGEEFSLELRDREELTERTLPTQFQRVEETRFLISTVLHSFIFAGKARFFRYRAKVISPVSGKALRRVGNELRPTLYDLILKKGEQELGSVFHALCLRPGNRGLRFAHLTDLHIALRNDLYDDNLSETITYSASQGGSGAASESHFNNFNDNLRLFIRYANELADRGELDFVLIPGDLVDFLSHGFHEREDYGDNNLQVFRNLILGAGNEVHRPQPNPGLKVPVFTSTGNHDWRFFPYDVAVHQFGLRGEKEVAKQFDLFWADEQEEISQKIEAFYANLLREGSPISNRTWMGIAD